MSLLDSFDRRQSQAFAPDIVRARKTGWLLLRETLLALGVNLLALRRPGRDSADALPDRLREDIGLLPREESRNYWDLL